MQKTQHCLLSSLLVLSTFFLKVKAQSQTNYSDDGFISQYYIREILSDYGSGEGINLTQFQRLVGHFNPPITNRSRDLKSLCNISNLNWEAATDQLPCWKDRCLSATEIWQLSNIGDKRTADSGTFSRLLPIVLYQIQSPLCHHVTSENTHHHLLREEPAKVWGYGFLCVTANVLSGLLGCAVFVGLSAHRYYEYVLMSMVSLAIGVLTGLGLVFLIPEALNLHTHYGESHEYIWKLTVVATGIYFLFIFERVIKIVKKAKEKKKKNNVMEINQMQTYQVKTQDHAAITEEETSLVNHNHNITTDRDIRNGEAITTKDGKKKKKLKVSPLKSFKSVDETKEIETVAWVLVIGDTLHNFADGVTVGAGFAQGTLTGFTITLCMIIEHIPHKLGDFAILLNAGMSLKQSVCYTLLAGILCYLGFVVGVLVGEWTDGTSWILALAAGIFLYIALADMLPEISDYADLDVGLGEHLKIFALQNMGIIAGYILMLVVATYVGDISFD